jgi:hypothetical protein
MSDWLERRRTASGLPHPNSPASQMYDWSSSGVPHPNSPAGQHFDWPSTGMAHPSSPAGQIVSHPPKLTLKQRFIEVLRLTPNHLAPELAAQFRAMLTWRNLEIFAGSLAILAALNACGPGEFIDAAIVVTGWALVGWGVFPAAKDLYECVKITMFAGTESDLDRAADYFAQAAVILGFVALFAFLAKVGQKFAGSSAEEGSAGAAAEKSDGTSSDAPPSKEPSPQRDQSLPKETRDPVAARQAANKALRDSPQFEKDLAKANVSKEQLQWMNNKEAPLGFDSPGQFLTFKQELLQALQKDGLDDAEVGMKGTATTFYSENPGKPLGHFWDADPTHPGDYDLNLSSDQMAQQMGDAGIDPSPKYGVFRTSDVNSQFPALSDFSAKWSETLGRDVNVVGYPADTVPARDPTEFILVK